MSLFQLKLLLGFAVALYCVAYITYVYSSNICGSN